MIDVKAKGSGYYRVFADDGTGPVQLSQHTTEREAESRAINEAIRLAFETPGSRVYYSHDYEVDVTINTATATMIVTGGGVITPGDQIADPIADLFVDQTDVTISTTIPSNQITILGIDVPTSISVNFGEYQINGGAWVSAPGTVEVDDLVAVRHQSSGQNSTPTNQILTIGGVIQDTFTLTTGTINAILWNEPAFLGYSKAEATSITVGTVYTNVTSGEAPLALYASASNTVAPGTNSLDGLAISPYMHLDHRWAVTAVSGGASVASAAEITNPNTRQPVNMFSDQAGPEAALILHQPGVYDITQTSTDVNGVTDSGVAQITVNEPTYSHQFFDGASGNDINDGNDALGLSLSGASFTHSTRTLSHAGLASYDHAAATSNTYLSDNSNWIWLEWNGAASSGWFRIESKPTSTTVILAISLGADFSDVSSSDGPKETFNAASIADNTAYHFSAGQVYTVNSTVDIDGLNVYFFAYGSGDHATLRAGANMGGMISSNVGSGSVGDIQAHRIIWDGSASGGISVSGGVVSITYPPSPAQNHFNLILDRCRLINTTSARVIVCQGSGESIPNTHFFWDTDLDGRQITTERKAGCVLLNVNAPGHSVVVGCRSWGKATDGPTFDHHYYITGRGDHRLRSYNEPKENQQDLAYVFNENCGPTGSFYTSQWLAYVHNRFDHADTGIDGSNTQSDHTAGYGTFENTVIILNSFDGSSQLGATRNGHGILWGSTDSAFIGHNLAISLADTGPTQVPLFQTVDDVATAYTYLEGNLTYNCPLTNVVGDSANYQLVNNVGRLTHLDSRAFRWSLSTNGADTFIDGNQYWAPEDSNGNIYENNPAIESLATLNARANANNNTESDPGFADPANNDFRVPAVADIKVEIVKFTTLNISTGPGPQVIPLTPGFGTPKAAILIQSGDVNDGAGYNNGSYCIGYSDGTNNIACYVMNDSEAANGGHQEALRSMQELVSLRVQSNPGMRNGMRATFEEDQVSLVYDFFHASSTEEFAAGIIVFGGADITNASVGLLDNLGTGSPVSVNTGFQPDIFFALSNHFTSLASPDTFNPNDQWSAKNDLSISHGVAIRDGSNSQMAVSWYAEDTRPGPANGQNTKGLYNDALLASMDQSAVENWTIALTSFDATGVTLTPSASPASSLMGYLAMEFNGVSNIKIVDTTIPTINDMTVSGVGFQPIFGMGYHINNIAAYNTPEDLAHSQLCHYFDSSTMFSSMNNNVHGITMGDAGNAARYGSEFQMMLVPTSISAGNTAIDVNSSGYNFNADGVTFTMTNWPANTVRGRMLFLGNN